MFYALSEVFQDNDIEEIEGGIVDAAYRKATYDFGIDAIYITTATDFIEDPQQLAEYNDDTKFKIHIFQFKKGGVSQSDLLKFNSGVKRIIVDENLSKNENLYLYTRMIALNKIKDGLYERFSSDQIQVVCHIVFGGMAINITSDSLLMDEIKNIKSQFTNNGFINVEINILDCQELINLSTGVGKIVDTIEYQKTFKYITDIDSENKLNGYISIVKGKNIADLVKKYQTAIFEANIRDYYKRSDINSKIIETCSSNNESKFFWSYNNGLTMTCSKVEEIPNNKYRLHNFQIVNGCQTSNALYVALKNKDYVAEINLKIKEGKELSKEEKEGLAEKSRFQFNDDASVLLKIIETKNEDFIGRITETTNSQTPIKEFSLKANDDIQKLIEQYLIGHGVFYERRVNFYKNKGKKNIYSIQKLFQLYTSQVLFKPSQVKTRPKDMFVTTYDDVFPAPHIKSFNYVLYLIPIKIDVALNRGIRQFLKLEENTDNYKITLLSYARLHLGCLILSSILKDKYDPKGIIENETYINNEINKKFDSHFNDALENLERIIKNFAGNKVESIPESVRKIDLDARIVRFIKGRK